MTRRPTSVAAAAAALHHQHDNSRLFCSAREQATPGDLADEITSLLSWARSQIAKIFSQRRKPQQQEF